MKQTGNRPVLIVGLGLAGTLLSWFLRREGVDHLVIDDADAGSSSRIAAGIINPITGRRLTKSWEIDRLLPFARDTYLALGNFLDQSLWMDREILVLLRDPEERQAWLIKSQQEEFQVYLNSTCLNEKEWSGNISHLRAPAGIIRVRRAGQVDLPLMLEKYAGVLSGEGRLLREPFIYENLRKYPGEFQNGWQYGGELWHAVIFCEGYRAIHNPWFDQLPWRFNRGQRWIVQLPGLKQEAILRKGGMLAPLGEDRYWFGSVNDWAITDPQNTPEAALELGQMLAEMVELPWSLEGHETGIRPVLRDRRPAVGFHPGYPGLGVFNGLGTKGASLGPVYAEELALNISVGQPISTPVLPTRFFRS